MRNKKDDSFGGGTRIPGPHYVLPKKDLKVGQFTDRKDGGLYGTLTVARKVSKPGDAIVRKSDGMVVSVK